MSDVFSRTVFHRDVTADDTPLLTLAERARLMALVRHNRLNAPLDVQGAENIDLQFYGLGNDNGTFVATVVGIPAILDRLPGTQAPAGPRLLRLGTFTVTLGTSTETNLNPITGEAATGTWRAADTIVTGVEGTGVALFDVGGTNGVSRLQLDPANCSKIFVYISSMTNVTRVVVSASRKGNG